MLVLNIVSECINQNYILCIVPARRFNTYESSSCWNVLGHLGLNQRVVKTLQLAGSKNLDNFSPTKGSEEGSRGEKPGQEPQKGGHASTETCVFEPPCSLNDFFSFPTLLPW